MKRTNTVGASVYTAGLRWVLLMQQHYSHSWNGPTEWTRNFFCRSIFAVAHSWQCGVTRAHTASQMAEPEGARGHGPANSNRWFMQCHGNIAGYFARSLVATPDFLPNVTLAPSVTNETQFFWRYSSEKPESFKHFTNCVVIHLAVWLLSSTRLRNMNSRSPPFTAALR